MLLSRFICSLYLFIGLSLALSAVAEKLPKLEVGVALASQYLADYRGSSEYHVHAVPLPILLYRGDRFRIDRRGVHGDIFSSKRWELNVSGEASLSGSDDNSLREGMPDLDSAFEFGPSLNFHLAGKSMHNGLSLRLPLRAVVTVGSAGVDYIGYLANPKLTYRIPDLPGDWRISNNLGALWASSDYHAYYYDVDTPYVTPTRTYYRAESGYSGWYLKSSVSRRINSWFVGASLRYDNVSGAVFADSPLVETDDYFAVSFFVAKFLWDSD